VDDDHLLLFVNNQFWLLSGDGESIRIGTFDQALGLRESISPDGRYVVVMDETQEPTAYRVWDNLTKTYVAEIAPGKRVTKAGVIYAKDGFLLYVASRKPVPPAVFYSYKDGKTMELPIPEAGHYVEVMSDTQFLFEQRSGAESGIYRYDTTSNMTTLILKDGQAIALQPIENLKSTA